MILNKNIKILFKPQKIIKMSKNKDHKDYNNKNIKNNYNKNNYSY